MLSGKEKNKVSKFLSYILRHKPESIGLKLDSNGWLLIMDIINNSGKEITLSEQIILETVKDNDKKRFSISENGKYIRANQGHSVAVNLQLTPKKPPKTLYHGTATRFLPSISEQGLKSGQRQHVHLSTDINTAINVGSRYGKPVVLTIDSEKMHSNGYQFFISDNHVWLTEYVPNEYLSQIKE